MKQFKNGMYGGKFMPFHKGHFHCVEMAAKECETVHVLLMVGGNQEKEILSQMKDTYLQPENRYEQVKNACSKLPNVKVHMIDISDCTFEDGTEDWDAETPLVLAATGELDAVYGSEVDYADYFHRAYPNAAYRIVDINRKQVPISGTMIRNMNSEERKLWII